MHNQKTILITGAGSGIGRDSAIALAKREHRVIATTHSQQSAKELTDYLHSHNLEMTVFKLDVTNSSDRNKILNYDIDVLLNNAGQGESGSLAEIPIDNIRSDFETNVFGPFELSQLALRKMIKNDNGTVLFVSSLAGRVTMPFLGSYSMTKFALSSGAEALRRELKLTTDNVHIALIEPGGYATGFNQKNIAKKYKWMHKNSYFYPITDQIKSSEEKYFNRLESRSTRSIVKKIVKACESKNPKLRYSAPTWQCVGVQLMRMFGR